MASAIRPGAVVWLVPRTMGAPAICYRQLRAEVVRLDGPYVVVQLPDGEHRVHEDNVTAREPGTSTRPRPVPRPRPAWPGGYEEQLLPLEDCHPSVEDQSTGVIA